MSSNPQHDRPLVHFLQQHRPLPPAGPLALEDQLMAQLPQQTAVPLFLRRSRLTWGLSLTALVGVLVGAVLIPPSWRTARQAAKPAELEAFLVESWSVTAPDGNADESMLFAPAPHR